MGGNQHTIALPYADLTLIIVAIHADKPIMDVNTKIGVIVLKKIIIGFIAGVIFATAGTSFASSVMEKVTSYIRHDYVVELDGKELKLSKPPLVYDGSSHLPLREIATMFDKEVDFNNGVIQITTPPDKVPFSEPIESLNIIQIKIQISSIESYIILHQRQVDELPMSEEEKEEKLATIEKYKQRLEELKARKAEIESAQ